jgi:transposase-like protein
VKKKDCYDLNAIDNVTKFVVAHSFVERRTKEVYIKFLQHIKDACYPQILERYEQGDRIEFICDKFANYKTAFNKFFYRVCVLHFGVPIACKKYQLVHNNNPIERYNGKLKDRIKNIRSGFKSFDDATCFMNLRRTIHNFVNPHQQLKGKTPAEVADIIAPLKRNKLLNLIRFVRDNDIILS